MLLLFVASQEAKTTTGTNPLLKIQQKSFHKISRLPRACGVTATSDSHNRFMPFWSAFSMVLLKYSDRASLASAMNPECHMKHSGEWRLRVNLCPQKIGGATGNRKGCIVCHRSLGPKRTDETIVAEGQGPRGAIVCEEELLGGPGPPGPGCRLQTPEFGNKANRMPARPTPQHE